jgi:hypothetical protein
VDRIDEPEPPTHEIARQDETDGTGGHGNKKFEHKTFLLGSALSLHYGTLAGKIQL